MFSENVRPHYLCHACHADQVTGVYILDRGCLPGMCFYKYFCSVQMSDHTTLPMPCMSCRSGHRCVCVLDRWCWYTNTHTHTHTCMHACTHVHTHPHAHTHTHACTHPHTHAHTHNPLPHTHTHKKEKNCTDVFVVCGLGGGSH